MNIELLTIYTLSADGQTFSRFLVDGEPVKLLDYDYMSERMGSTSLTATLKHAKCLDSYWTGREFVVLDEASLQGGTPVGSLEAFFLSHTPSSSKDNTDARYVHTLEFRSRRDIFLSGVYYRDTVAAGAASASKFSSDDYSVTFVGTLDEFVQRFNDVMTALGLSSRFSVSVEQAYQGTTESLEMSFDRLTLAEVLQRAYDTWKVPYYFVGDSAAFGDGGATPIPVQYGPDDELLSVQKNNQNAKTVTRISGHGSSENVPYYYPNPTPKGWLSAGGTAEGVEVTDMLAFCQKIGLSDILTYMGRDAEYVSVSVTAGYSTRTSQGSDTTAALEDLSVVSGKKQTFGARLTSDLSGGYVGALEMGLYAPMGCAAGIDPDAPIRHFWSQDDDPSTPQAGSIRAASLVCDKGWDIVVDRVKMCLGDGMSLSNPHEVEITDFVTVTVSNDVAPEDKGLFADEKVVGVRVSADAVRAYVESLPAGSDLSRVTLVIVGHLQTHVLWMLPPDGQGSGWENVEFVAERLQVSKESYTPMGWYVGGSPLGMTLAEVGLSIEGEPEVGDTITQVVTRKVPATGCIMPSVYIDTDGAARFYEATDTPPEAYAQAYVDPETGENYDFEHQYDALEPHEHVEDFEDVKPTIKNLKDGQGNPLNVLSEVYFDDGYNIEDMTEDGHLRYSHFFVKLKALGFNLFACAIEDGDMEVVMPDGPCAGCRFRILVTEDGKNAVQKNANGTLKKVDGYGVIDEGNIQPNQQDTTSNAVWIALLQDDSTFGGPEVENGVMPSYNKNTGAGQRPLTGNAYTLGNINLPAAFYRAAEQELDRQLVGFMAKNNADKFQYPVAFSRVYLAENPTVRDGLSVRSSLLLTYAGVTLPAPLYVSQMTVSVKEGEALPDIRVETSDIIESRTAGLDERIAAAVDSRVVSVVGAGGGLPIDVADQRYLRKDRDDSVAGVTTFLKGFKVGNYIPGAGGIGGSIYTGSSGEAIAEVDILHVRRKAVFTQVEVDSMRKVGGTIMLTLADMKISAVEEVSGGWKCYFKSDTADGGALQNGFVAGDQAICQTFLNDNTHFFWRLVTSVGPDWIVLSREDCAAGSDAPEVGDTVVQLGNRTDASRRSAQVLSCYGEDSPSFVIYAGIDSYSLAGKDISGFVYRETSAGSGVYRPHFFNYGPMLLGDRSKTQEYVEYNNGALTLKGTLIVKTGSTSYQTMTDYMAAVQGQISGLQSQIDGQVQSWSSSMAPTAQTKPYPLWDEETQAVIGTPNYPYTEWQDATEREKHFGDIYVDDTTGQGYRFTKGTVNGSTVYYWTRITDEEVALAMQLAQAAKNKVDALDYLKEATNNGATLVSGGLILSNLIALGKTENEQFRVWAGVNGLRDTTKTGNGIAAWYGGEMMEKAEYDAMTPEQQAQHQYGGVPTYAKSLFRMNGSGYLAGGNIHWDEDGYGGIPGITWSRPSGSQNDVITIGSNVVLEAGQGADQSVAALVSSVNSLQQILDWFEEVNFGTEQQPIWGLRLKRKTVNGVTYDRAFVSYGDQIVGSGTPGGGGGGGAQYLWQLDDVNVPTDPLEIVDGQALLWNAATQRWVNANVVTDLSNYYTKAQTYSKTEMDGKVEDIDDAMDNLQAQIDAVSSRDMFDELTASVLFADIIAASDIYGALHGDADNALNLEGHAASYFAAASAVTALENNFDSSGNAKAALKLTTSGPLSIWGVQYWNNGIPSDVTGRPNLYIGSTQVQTVGNTQPLEGISTITLVAQSTRSTSGNVIEVVTESDGQGGTITYLHTTLPIISDGDQIVGAGTPGGGSGGGAAYLHELLDVIANLVPSDGYLLAWDANATSQAGSTGAWKAISQSSVLAPVTALIPAQASASNQLADKDFVNSSIATATATYRGSYNLVSDLGLTTAATESQIGTALASAVSDEDNNDYAFVQIPTSDDTPTEIARTDRYKYNGSAWVFEYSLNNSGYTAAQWAAINSGITTAKRQGYDAIAGYFDANGKLTPAHVGDLSATYALVSHTHTIAQVTNLQDELDALSARIDSVASRDDFDELTASVIFADIIAAGIFYGNLEGNADTATDADKLDGQHGSYYATASSVSTLQDYFDADGHAKSALKLTTVSKTAWGRTFWTANGVPDSVSGDMDSVGKISFTAQNAKSTTGFVLEVVTESDGQGGTITYLHTTLPIISDGDQIVGAGTPGGGSGGGAAYLHELLDVIDNLSPSDGYVLAWDASAMSQAGSTGAWKAISQSSLRPDLSNYYTKAETYSQAEVNAIIGAIDQFHYEIAASTSAVVDPQSNVLYLIGPTGSGADKYEEYVYTNSTWTKIGDTSIDLSNYYTKSETYSKTEVDTALNGYVPTTRTVSGTGYLTGGGALSQNQTLDIASAVKTKIDHGESAYSALPDINALLDNLQAQVDAVSSRDCYDELTATVFYSDIVAATDIYGALHGDADNALNLEGHAASYFATASAVTTLQGYFDNSGNAKTALKLTTSGPLNIWGVQYWNSGVPSAVTGRPSFGAGADVPAGQTFKIGDATFSWVAGSNGNPGYLYVDTAFMSAGDQIIGSGTPGQGGGGGGKNYLYELLDTAYAWDAAFPAGISEQQVLVYTPNADSKNGTGTGAWSHVPKTAVGAFYTAGTGLALSNANVFSLDVNAAKTALGLGDAAYLDVASTIGASVSGLVSGALLYGVLGDSFDSTNTVKAFVNSSIATATATFRGTNTTATTEAAFLTWANALTHDLNDYVFWQTTDSYGNTIYKRYKFDGTSWVFEYNLNNSSFTTAQWDAINSGITSTKRSGYDTIVGYFTNGQLQAAHVGDLSGAYLPKSGGSMNNTTVVTNLNADLLDGKHASEFAAATHSHTISQVTNLESNLDTLSGRIDAIGSRNMFDELSASVFFSDIVTASTAYIESIVGSLTGTASNASQLEGHAASYFATASSLNSYLLLSGGTMTGTLTMKANQYNDAYAGALNMNNSNIYGLNSIYTADVSDDQSEGIHFYRDSTHVDSLRMASGSLLFTPNRPLGGTATEYTVYHSGNSNKSDVSWTTAHLDTYGSIELRADGSSWNEGIRMHPATNGWSGIVFCEASNSGSTGTSANTWSIHNHEGVFGMYKNGSNKSDTNAYLDNTSGAWGMGGNLTIAGSLVTSGDQTISSDETLKMNLEDIRLSAKDIAGVRAVTFDWKDGRGRSFGTIAQDWLGILPEAVSGEEGNYSVAYAQAAMVAAVVNSREIVEIEKHETEQDNEIRELKAALGKANGRIADLEKKVEQLRKN